jgi:hypothetical protein
VYRRREGKLMKENKLDELRRETVGTIAAIGRDA